MERILRVNVVIVNWNGGPFLKRCLESVKEQGPSLFEVIVIDNNSNDESHLILAEQKKIRVLYNKKNIGFSAACNQGIRLSEGEAVLVLNSDVVLGQSYLEEVTRFISIEERIGMVTGRILRFDHRTIDTCGQILGKNRKAYDLGYGEIDQKQFLQTSEVFSVCGAVAFYKRTMLDDISLNGEYFDEDFFAFYEDMDLGWRAQNRGWKAYYTPRALAYHFRGGSNGSSKEKHRIFNQFEFVRRPRFIQAHIILNRYLMIIKNDSIKGFLKDIFSILKMDFYLWVYILLFRSLLIWDLIKISGNIPKAFQKRKWIQDKNRRTLTVKHRVAS